MNTPFRIPTKVRIAFSKLGSLLLLFQRTPLVQILLPEARVLGTSGMGEVVKWSVAAIAGLGAFDTVAGATVISQVTPSPNSTTVPAKTGIGLTFLVQVTGAPSSKAGSWEVVGSLPPGLVHANKVNSSTDSITGTPTAIGNYPITIKAWEDPGYGGGFKSQAFNIVVTDGGGGTVTAPAITGQPASTTINSGSTITLTVAASGTTPTFQWYRGSSGTTTNPVSGATSASFTTPALTATTSYWARATNTAGTANSNTATVTVISPPAITTQPVSTTINSGGTATLTVTASGTSPTFQWYRGNSGVTTNPVSGATSASFTTPALTTTTSYWARASNAAGNTNSNAATVTIVTPPSITTQPVSTTISSGGTATLTVAASGTSPTFQWYAGSTGITSNPVAGATSASFTTPALTSTTRYWARASNGAGTSDSNAATITVSTVTAPSITTQPVSTTINSGGTTTLTIAASGTSPTFQWYRGSSGITTDPVSGATSASFTTPALTANTSYWARATNGAGTSDSNAATVTVITPPAITTQPASISINNGESTTLTVAASGTLPTFQWYRGASGNTTNPVSGATSASFTTPALTVVTSYWVRVSNTAGSSDSNTATVTVAGIAGPVITTQPASTTINSGGTATLAVTASGDSAGFQWYRGNSGVTTDPVVGAISASFTTPALTTTTTYWVRASNVAGVSDSNAATVTVTLPEPGGAGPFKVGQAVTIDLGSLTSAGETLKLVGKLPKGLKLNLATGEITGTVTGLAGTYPIKFSILQGKSVMRTVDFPIVIAGSAYFTGKYEALLESNATIPAGAFKLLFKKGNTWSATLESPGAKARKAAGKVTLAPGSTTATLTANFAGSGSAPAVTLNATLDLESPMVSGTYNGGTVRGFRLAQDDELPAASNTLSLVFEAGVHDGITIPAGFGWANGSIGSSGTASFSGMLGDGTAINLPIHLSATGQAIVWSQPYANPSSYFGGIVTLPDLGQTPAADLPLTEKVWWFKGTDAKSLSYPGGFPAMEVTVGSSKWSVPATASALGASLGWLNNSNPVVEIDGAGLSNAAPQATTPTLPTGFTLDASFNLVAAASPAVLPWTGKATPANGTFTGSFTLPTGFVANGIAGPAAASGVLLQADAWGTVTGCGLIKVPVAGANGSFRTAAIILNQ